MERSFGPQTSLALGCLPGSRGCRLGLRGLWSVLETQNHRELAMLRHAFTLVVVTKPNIKMRRLPSYKPGAGTLRHSVAGSDDVPSPVLSFSCLSFAVERTGGKSLFKHPSLSV